MGLLPYFPLANGLLTGKYLRNAEPQAGSRLAARKRLLADAPWDRIEALRSFAKERELTMGTVAIGWLVAQPVVGSAITGATSADQVAANAAAADWRPSQEDLRRLDEICPPGRR